jgi:hypothetical protein
MEQVAEQPVSGGKNPFGDTAMDSPLSLAPKDRLRDLMHELSEIGTSAGWYHNLEYILWRACRNGQGSLGTYVLAAHDLSALTSLSDRAEGWWTWRNGKREFVPISEWTQLYDVFMGDEDNADWIDVHGT